mgnify:CR=1 FL=1
MRKRLTFFYFLLKLNYKDIHKKTKNKYFQYLMVQN